jgi:hypothetical protein
MFSKDFFEPIISGTSFGDGTFTSSVGRRTISASATVAPAT